MILQRTRILRLVLGTAAVLLVPYLAMQFTDEVAWGPGDFGVAGALLLATGLAFEVALTRTKRTAYRIAAGLALATALVLVWMNLAVGLIGNEDNPANLLFVGVLAVGLVGTVVARLDPRGMERTMLATALTQALVPVIAMMIWRPPMTAGVVGVLMVNALFVVLWVLSALLFGRATVANAGPDAGTASEPD